MISWVLSKRIGLYNTMQFQPKSILAIHTYRENQLANKLVLLVLKMSNLIQILIWKY